jgi:Resolvase, N terminal domain
MGSTLIRDRYDNGGFSGGSMERPALRKLLDNVRQGQTDVVVVYRWSGTVTRTEFGRAQFSIPSSGSGRGGGPPRPETLRLGDSERVSGGEMALNVEGVVDSGVNRQEALG